MGILCSKEHNEVIYVIRLKEAIRKYFKYHLGQVEPPSIQYLKELSSIRRTLKLYNINENDVFLYEDIEESIPMIQREPYIEITIKR